ncbi:hypothetical protein JS510_00700 [Mycoplasma tauri]|uniref:relaxase MobL n=1 Tax=Mycoplasma tauri TaxID=547987 RepID=UPI001967356F|nr:relaxase MobL [Mycoplasma tauri]QSB07634.1 hypothetical protein JS510_00700 [Mycoplasma tauri]
MVDYITRNDKCVSFSEVDNSSIKEIMISMTMAEKQEWYFNHLKKNQKNPSSGIYSLFDEKVKDLNIKKIKSELFKNENTVYEGFLNLGQLGLEGNILTKNDWIKLIKDEFEHFLKKSGFEINNLNAYFTIHGNTSNPHIHYFFYEKENLRKGKKIKLNDIQNFGFKIANKLKENKESLILQKLISETWNAKKIVTKNIDESFNSIKKQKLKTFLSCCKLIEKEMKNKNNKSYKLASWDVKDAVSEIDSFLYEFDPEYKKRIDEYNKTVNELIKFKNTTESKYLKNRIDILLKKEKMEYEYQKGNRIIKAALSNKESFKSHRSFAAFLSTFYTDDWEYKKLIKRAEKIFALRTLGEYENFIKYSKM